LRVLVTGGCGFIGTSLIKHLLKEEDIEKIVSLDNYFTGLLKNQVIDNRVSYIYEETANIREVLSDQEFDVVFHFGEYSRIDPSFDDTEEIFNFNLKGTWEVVNFCKDKNIRLIYSGSSSKFGHENNQHLSPYSWSKAKNTELIKNFAKWYGLKYNILYFHNVYGPGQIMEGKYATVIGIFEKQLEENTPLTVVSPGTQRRDFTHVDDIVSGIWAAFKKAPENTEFSLGTGKNYTIMEVAEAFNQRIIMLPCRRGERNTSLAEIDNTIEMLGWKPKNDVIEYIKNNFN
tara:strand:- start:1938 stop:2801 length:864 start_codon:yes stop_codon:yes gene_type:complete